MAETIQTSHAASATQFSPQVFEEFLQGNLLQPLMGTSENAVIQILTDLEADPGDTITYNFRPKLDRTLEKTGSAQLEGNEQDLTIYTDNLTVDERASGVIIRNKDISNQRTAFDLPTQARNAIIEDITERSFYRLMTALLDTTAGRTANRYLYGSLTSNYNATEATAKGNVDSTDDKLTPDMIEAAKRMALNLGNARVRPANISEEADMPVYEYVFLAHAYAVRDLVNHPKWQNHNYNDRIAKGTGGSNGALYVGSYRGVAIYEIHDDVLIDSGSGAGSIDLAHNLLLGAQAGVQGFAITPEIREREADYGRQMGFAGFEISGENKTVFNSEDFGAVHVYSSGVAD